MSLAVAERVRAHRERLQRHRALLAAALAKQLPVDVLAGELEQLQPLELEALKWQLAGQAALHAPRNERIAHDAYFTRPPVAKACTLHLAELLRKWKVPTPARALEPHAGLGAFVTAIAEVFPNTAITAVDIVVRPQLRELTRAVDGGFSNWPIAVVQRDFLQWKHFVGPYALIAGNPPFDEAELHVRHALELLAPGGVLAMILRAGFIASKKRNDPTAGLWARPGLRSWAPIVPRPPFIESGTDQTEYSFYVWQRGYRGEPNLGKAIHWEELEAPACTHPGCGHPLARHADSPEGPHRGSCEACRFDWSKCSGYTDLRGAA